MLITIPTIEKTWNEETQTVSSKIIEKPVYIDTSFRAHLKWEEQFSRTLGCDLATYTDRVNSWSKNPDTIKANLLGVLKLLYCYINADWLPTFIEFAALFDYEIAEKLLTKINTILGEVFKTAGKN